MALLSEPFEYVDLLPGAKMTIRVDRYELGSAVIHPTRVTARHVRLHMDQRGLEAPPAHGTPISVEVPVLRLFGERLDQPSGAKYFDVSAKTLQPDLLARFQNGAALPMAIQLTANGHAPHKRYSVEAL